MQRISLSEIEFGKTDAFNEIRECGVEWFITAFVKYEKYQIDKFIAGKNYYICGEKGTGKTALLRYLQYTLSKDPENLIIPIRFKSDLDNEDKKQLRICNSNINEAVVNGADELASASDSVAIWQVYIINKLFQGIDSTKGEYVFFENDSRLQQLKNLLKIIYPNNQSKIMPKLKHGKISIQAELKKVLNSQILIELNLDGNDSSINFSKIVKLILEKFKNLEFTRNRAYIIFDELELSVRTQKEYQRDIQLVRDLIIAVDRFNELCKVAKYDIHVIASIRSEVIHSVHSAGYEINKSIEDFGVSISWYQKKLNYLENPLLKIIENKIIACEEAKGITEHGNIWEKYFAKTVAGIETRKYILNYSWMHPRDIVRLMNKLVEQCDDELIFTSDLFERSMQAYAVASWTEISEALRLKYPADDLASIKNIFTNIEVPFTYQMILKRINALEDIYPKVKEFAKKHMLATVLEDLFQAGVVGNTGQRMIFKFLGDDTIALTEDMIIHKPLRDFFCVKSRQNNVYEIYDDSDE